MPKIRIIYITILAGLLLCSCIPKTPDKPTPDPPVPPEPEDPDPITLVTTPGAYGVEGGTIEYDLSKHQLSRLEYRNGWSYRLLCPEDVTVASISGLPGDFKAGDSVTFLYRVQQQGHSWVNVTYTMTVLQIKDGKAWLKKDDETYFVILL